MARSWSNGQGLPVGPARSAANASRGAGASAAWGTDSGTVGGQTDQAAAIAPPSTASAAPPTNQLRAAMLLGPQQGRDRPPLILTAGRAPGQSSSGGRSQGSGVS